MKFMKLFTFLSDYKKKKQNPFYRLDKKAFTEYQQEALIKIGGQQFQKLKELGLAIPVALS